MMHTVTFARQYTHKLDELREAVYPPDIELSVSNEVFEGATKAGALKGRKEKTDGQRPAEGN